jgi:hypothetical protein
MPSLKGQFSYKMKIQPSFTLDHHILCCLQTYSICRYFFCGTQKENFSRMPNMKWLSPHHKSIIKLVHIPDIITLKDLSLTHYISLFLTVSVSSGTSVSLPLSVF